MLVPRIPLPPKKVEAAQVGLSTSARTCSLIPGTQLRQGAMGRRFGWLKCATLLAIQHASRLHLQGSKLGLGAGGSVLVRRPRAGAAGNSGQRLGLRRHLRGRRLSQRTHRLRPDPGHAQNRVYPLQLVHVLRSPGARLEAVRCRSHRPACRSRPQNPCSPRIVRTRQDTEGRVWSSPTRTAHQPARFFLFRQRLPGQGGAAALRPRSFSCAP